MLCLFKQLMIEVAEHLSHSLYSLGMVRQHQIDCNSFVALQSLLVNTVLVGINAPLLEVASSVKFILLFLKQVPGVEKFHPGLVPHLDQLFPVRNLVIENW